MHALAVHVLLRKILMSSRSVRHVLVVVVTVVFIKAPVLNITQNNTTIVEVQLD